MSLKIRKKFLIYLVCLLIWLPPESIQYSFPYSSLVFLGAQIGISIIIFSKYSFRLVGKLQFLLLLFLICNCFGMINYGLSISRIANYAVYCVGIFSMITFFQNQKKSDIGSFRNVVWFLWVFSIVLTFYHYFTTELSTVYGSEVYFWGSRAITMQAFVALMGVSVFFDVYCEGQICKKTILLTGASFAFAVVRTSGQGISMILVFVLLMVLNIFQKQKLWKIITPTVVILGIVLLNYLVISLRFQDIDVVVRYITQVLSKDISLTGRDQIFSGSLELFAQHPIIGYGYGNQIIYDVLGKIWKAFNTAHNSVLQIMVDFGIMGTALFSFFMYSFFGELRNGNKYEDEVIYFVVIAMFVGGLVNMIILSEYYWIVVCLGTASISKRISNIN